MLIINEVVIGTDIRIDNAHIRGISVTSAGDCIYSVGRPLIIKHGGCSLVSYLKADGTTSTRLSISSRDESGMNIKGSSVDELKSQINKFKEDVHKLYNIEIDVSSCYLTKIEIHKTLTVSDDPAKYYRPIVNLLNVGDNESLLDSHAGYYQFNSTIMAEIKETGKSGYNEPANGAFVKFYDKSGEVLEKHDIITDQNYLRVEITLGKCGSHGSQYSIIKLLGTTNPYELTDDYIADAFMTVMDYFTNKLALRGIVNRNDLVAYINTLSGEKSNKSIAYNLLLEASSTETAVAINRVRFLDVEDILKALKNNPTKLNNRKIKEVRKHIRKIAPEQSPYFVRGDGLRFTELISKIYK